MTHGDLTAEALALLRTQAQALVGRCHRCAVLRQQHRDGMAHAIEDTMAVSARDLLALLDAAHVRDTGCEALREALDTRPEDLPEPRGPVARKWWRLGWLSAQAVVKAALTDAGTEEVGRGR